MELIFFFLIEILLLLYFFLIKSPYCGENEKESQQILTEV
jgi:hypothetical protein